MVLFLIIVMFLFRVDEVDYVGGIFYYLLSVIVYNYVDEYVVRENFFFFLYFCFVFVDFYDGSFGNFYLEDVISYV